jgi:hypothetical protein
MLKEKKVSVLIKKYILYVLILEGRGKYRFSKGRKGKVSVLIKKKRESIYSHNEEKEKYLFSEGKKRESICSHNEEKEKYLFSEGKKGKVSVLIKKKRESICSHKEEKRNYLFS